MKWFPYQGTTKKGNPKLLDNYWLNTWSDISEGITEMLELEFGITNPTDEQILAVFRISKRWGQH